MNELDFITDKALRKTIEDSIEYTYLLFEQSKKEEETDLFREETYRVIVLYIISVIEAVLLYLFKSRKEEINYLEYKFIHNLPAGYKHSEGKKAQVIIAVQKNSKKSDHQIGLFELVTFFKDKKLIKLDISKEILGINEVRNTFHFSKPRHEIVCEIKQVEKAYDLLVKIIQITAKIPMKKKK
jgi:hypothetical protein